MMKYRKISKLGEGSLGNVYKVENPDTGAILAMKIFYFNTVLNDRDYDHEGNIINLKFLEEHYLPEIKILSLLKHPHIIRYYTSEIEKTRVVILTEVWGTDIYKTKISRKVMKSIMYQLTSALYYLHQNYIHRDIKPSNILMNGDNIVKIADFGCCIEKGRTDYDWQTTLWYSAPEICLGSKNYDTKIDIWSLGCVFYEKIMNSILFRTENNHDNLYEQWLKINTIMGNPSSNSILYSLPNAKWIKENVNISDLYLKCLEDKLAIDLIQQMLKLDPNERISAEDILKHDYFQSDNTYKTKIEKMDNIKIDNEEIETNKFYFF